MLNDSAPIFRAHGIAHEAQALGLDEYHLSGPVSLPHYSPADAYAGYEAVMHTDPYEADVDVLDWQEVSDGLTYAVLALFLLLFAAMFWPFVQKVVQP